MAKEALSHCCERREDGGDVVRLRLLGFKFDGTAERCESDGSGFLWLRLNDRDVRPAILEILIWAKWILYGYVG